MKGLATRIVDREELKRFAAEAALSYVEAGGVLGVGSGSTSEYFVRALATSSVKPRAAVAASERSRSLLESVGIPVVGLAQELLPLTAYVDGADEVDGQLRVVKGGGGALTREKIVAVASQRFVCIVDETKLVPALGTFAPVPLEVLPIAVDVVIAELQFRGARAAVRDDFETDNGNVILDVTGLDLSEPENVELDLDGIPGVVECGIFARRRPDAVLIGTAGGVRRLERAEE